MFQDVFLTLSRLGLKRPDVQVLLACMHHKDGLFVFEICSATKIKRSTVYLSLKRLMSSGYLTQVKIGNRHKYFAEKPETIIFKQEQLLDDLKILEPILNRLSATTGATEIRFFEGVEGIRQIYRDMLLKVKFTEGDTREILSISSGADIVKLLPDFQKFFVDKRVRLGVPIRIIAPQSAKTQKAWLESTKELRQMRYFDNKIYPFQISLELYGDSVTIYSPSKPIGGVIIRNDKIAKSLRSFFYLNWMLLSDNVVGLNS